MIDGKASGMPKKTILGENARRCILSRHGYVAALELRRDFDGVFEYVEGLRWFGCSAE